MQSSHLDTRSFVFVGPSRATINSLRVDRHSKQKITKREEPNRNAVVSQQLIPRLQDLTFFQHQTNTMYTSI